MDRSDILWPPAEMAATNFSEKKNECAPEVLQEDVLVRERRPLQRPSLKSAKGFFFNPRSSWKTKILFAIEELPGGSLSEIAEHLHRLDPEKSIDEVLTYVTWYTVQMQNENGITAVSSGDEEFCYEL